MRPARTRAISVFQNVPAARTIIERPHWKPTSRIPRRKGLLLRTTTSTIGLWAALVLAILPVSAVRAADVIFPKGARIGLAPLPGLAPATAFTGFESLSDAVKILVTELPAAAYAEVEATLKVNPAGRGPVKPEPIEIAAGKAFYTVEAGKVGETNVRRYSMILPGPNFTGYVAVQVTEKAEDKFSDDAIKGMLATVAVRNEVPLEEQLQTMPFTLTEISGFKTVKTIAPGAAMLLSDASGDTKIESAPFMIVGTIVGTPDKADDRERFARQAVGEIPGLREGKITMAEPVRIDGAPGFEIRVDALSGKDSVPVTVVQWLRFGGGSGAVRIVASTPRDQWAAAFPRFRAVRDGLQGK